MIPRWDDNAMLMHLPRLLLQIINFITFIMIITQLLAFTHNHHDRKLLDRIIRTFDENMRICAGRGEGFPELDGPRNFNFCSPASSRLRTGATAIGTQRTGGNGPYRRERNTYGRKPRTTFQNVVDDDDP